MIKKLLEVALAGLMFGLSFLVLPADAQSIVAGKATVANPTCLQGAACALSQDLAGNLRVIGGSGGGALSVIGARANAADAISNSNILGRMVDPSGNLAYLGVLPYVFNGSTWDRVAGNTLGNKEQGTVATGTAIASAGNPVYIAGKDDSNLVRPIAVSPSGNVYVSATGATQSSVTGCSVTGCFGLPIIVSDGTLARIPLSDTAGVQLMGASGTTAASAALSTATTAAIASNIVAKSGAGNFYSANLTSGASAGYFMLFDATAAPADGAVTPFKCWVAAANSTISISNNPPIRAATGITVVFSTTGCFAKLASATAFMSVDYE